MGELRRGVYGFFVALPEFFVSEEGERVVRSPPLGEMREKIYNSSVVDGGEEK